MRVANNWNLLTSFLGMVNLSKGKWIGNTQSKIGLEKKPLVKFSQEEVFQRKTAKSRSKTIRLKVFKGHLQKGHPHTPYSRETTIRPILA